MQWGIKILFHLMYDIEDIYEWLDYIRRMGIEQVFV